MKKIVLALGALSLCVSAAYANEIKPFGVTLGSDPSDYGIEVTRPGIVSLDPPIRNPLFDGYGVIISDDGLICEVTAYSISSPTEALDDGLRLLNELRAKYDWMPEAEVIHINGPYPGIPLIEAFANGDAVVVSVAESDLPVGLDRVFLSFQSDPARSFFERSRVTLSYETADCIQPVSSQPQPDNSAGL